MRDQTPPILPLDPDDLPGIHVNDSPKDDPTRLLVHYDGKPWPWLVAIGIACMTVGFAAGVQYGTDHYTISTSCSPKAP